ncbi:MAG: HU family DNA-binding protein [Thermotogaceae bacterium]|nr:HU family DNA-binding protein [Thermotogaceae bacterium]RKX40853.1 MAG: integration host factor [Thermotogota bacterium]
MNKTELIDKVAKKSALKKKDVKAVVDIVFDTISEALAKGDKVQLVGFGSFEVRKAAERRGVNPQTKKPIKIPARKVPKFRPGKALKEKVK